MEAVKTETFFGTKYVPLRSALDQFGGSIDWDNVGKQAIVHAPGKTAVVHMESNSVEVNGTQVSITQPPLVQNGILYVPEDFFSNVLGQNVSLL